MALCAILRNFPKTSPMVPALRKAFNEAFTRQRYDDFVTDLHSKYPGAIEFRVAETPVFIPKSFAAQLSETCEYIIDLITDHATSVGFAVHRGAPVTHTELEEHA